VTRAHYRSVFACVCAGLICGFSARVAAQDSQAQAPPAETHDDAALRPLEPDFKIVNLPTTLPLPVHGGNFELTHRFGGDFRREGFEQLASNLFGLDEGATISFGYRFGLFKHLEIAANRTNFDKDIELQAKYDPIHQFAGSSSPIGLSAIIAVEGGNNFSEDFQPALGLSISRTLGRVAAVYVDPFWVHNSAGAGSPVLGTRNTGFVGVGGRLRLMAGVFIVAEIVPRVAGYRPGDPQYAFGIEKRYGGHVFQLNFGNSLGGATYGQLARGGAPSLFMGFNLERKFF
jgi:Membrane bound beta barrel domain (DUF5777)